MKTAILVGEAAKVRCKVPKWLRFRGFARWVLAVANRVRRVGSGFNRAFHLENGCSDCKNGVFVFRFLYFSVLVRRNSFVNVVFAVGDAAEVRLGVPKWLWERGFAWWVAAVAGRSVGFIGCGIGFCCHVRAVSGWERGVVVWGIGGLRGGFVSFSCGEKEKDALRRPQK